MDLPVTKLVFIFILLNYSCLKNNNNIAEEFCKCFETIDFKVHNRLEYQKRINDCLYEFTLDNEILDINKCESFKMHSIIMDSLYKSSTKSLIENKSSCVIMREGLFEDISWKEEILIEQTYDFQTIYFPNRGNTYDKYSINWLDECKYETSLIETTDLSTKKSRNVGDISLISLIDIKEDTITYQLSVGESYFQLGRLIKVREGVVNR